MSRVRQHPDQMGHYRRFVAERQRNIDLPHHLRLTLLHAAKGRNNEEIAGLLHIAPHTVKNYIYHLTRFFYVTNRTSMVIEAMRRGYAPCPHGTQAIHIPRRKPRPGRRNL